MKLSIIYVHYNAQKEILESIKSVYKYPPKNSFEIVVVDNSPNQQLEEQLKQYSVVYIKSKNIGFGSGCNVGARRAKGKFFLFLNPDTRVRRGTLDLLLSHIEKNPTIGVLGPKMYDGNKKLLPTINAKITPSKALVVYSFINSFFKNNPISHRFWMKDVDRTQKQKVDVVSGACMMIPSRIFKEVKGFDKRFFLYFEEQDICIRIARRGYGVFFYPSSKIVHLGGRSLSDKEQIQSYFEKSRYLYLKKHFGKNKALLTEFCLRYFTINFFIAIFFIFLSFFINAYAQNSFMLFIGDAARDYNAARDMLQTGALALVGIPSSVSWLHQGPTSVWLIALALRIGNFNPVAPAYLYAFLGGITTAFVFYLANKLGGRALGIVSGIFYSFSPMIVVNARMPYHTSLVPFFTMLFFIFLYKTKKNINFFPVLCFAFGALLLVELSNIVAGLVAMLYLFSERKYISRKTALISFFSFIFGILPFVVSDFVNGPTYIKFPLWIVNRLRYFIVGMPESQEQSTVAGVWETFYQQFAGVISPHLPEVGIIALFISVVYTCYVLLKEKNTSLLFLILLWLMVPVFSFTLHKSPGTAYFGILYPSITILVSFMLVGLLKARRALIVILALAFMNGMLLLSNNFFVDTLDRRNPMPPVQYSFGSTWKVADSATREIVKDARGENIELIPQGTMSLYRTSLEPYKYLIPYNGGKINSKGIRYSVSDKIVGDGKIIFKSDYVTIQRYE